MVSFVTIKSSRVITSINFNVADSVRCDIKVLVTKTRYTVVADLDRDVLKIV